MRNETIIIDLANPVLTKTIYSRQNDKSGLKVTVHLKEYGKTVDLTGYDAKYEAANQSGHFVRDDAVIIDAVKGIFEYTFSKEAVSTPSVWAAYFAFEKSTTERFSTQDLKIVLGRDVKQGNIELNHYLSDFDKALEAVAGYRKEIDSTNAEITKLKQLIAANNVQVPKITTDVGGALLSVSDATKNILDEIVSRGLGINTIYCHGSVQGNTPNAKSWRGISFINSPTFGFVIAKDYQNKFYTNYIDNGTWIGWEEHVTLNDLLKTLNGWKFTTTALQLNGSNVLSKIATGFRFDSNLEVNGTVKQSTDTDWVNITPINGVTNQSGKTSKIKRSGNTVCLNMNVVGVKNNHIIASLPANFRPVSDLTFSATYVLNNLDTNTGFITLRTDGSVHCEWIAEGTNPLKNWSFTLTYII
ncbi:BppU family phage baseplate upper protein [Bacillus sp. UNC437CL72CviS29]|uniref:BppU family phage baseplate upper protein n=1 Tax=Bacillus sp. UNC437CL72CviS29 TaxID=1340430 RepID=UPI000558D4E9|nr:BppU family phage baseplate upper protein [Bacillus sp. UNC437CL72CviS29]